ncbi:UvrD-helicase domain-containing protein [Yinghuangia sp. YIM S09857]|uniref:UvrD-helicase domain-containing protein n=1 Tax=Yinghuangia sp. YIM S09857 TaxID=3436929 RepID=UPI003F530E3E
MGSPVLPADFVLLDEAQDTNPVLEEVFLAQDAQRVCVGDPAQQIYGWRNARDVMTGFPAEHLRLTQSFRFGPGIAEVANRWLRHADSEMQITGRGPASRIGASPQPDAVLCRGNADAMQEVFTLLDEGVPVALAGGGAALQRIAQAAKELKAGKQTSHPELFLFRTWAEVQDYVEHDTAGQDLRAIVKLVDEHGPDQIMHAVDRLCGEATAKVVVSTAHKAKGREWDQVRIGDGFEAPSVDDEGRQRGLNPAEARLIYVAVTRARTVLDPTGVAWIDGYEAAMTRAGQDGTAAGHPMIELSLTSQLKYDSSPVSQFMASTLPRSARLIADYQSRITGLPHPIQPIDVRYPDWSALGHAIDYRLRLGLGSRLGPAVALGVMAVRGAAPFQGAPPLATRKALHTAGTRLLAAIHGYLDSPGHLDEDAVIRLCFVAAYFEDIARSGALRRFSLLAKATPDTQLEDLTAAVPGYVLDDIAAQMRLADAPFRPFRGLPPQARVCGPVFAGSGDLGGADADFILDGLLLDCKATKDPRRLGREEIYQLAGYLLLDYDDQYRIDRVGLYLSRQGGLITWDVPEFLHRLGAAAPLPALRVGLRGHLRGAVQTPSRSRHIPRQTDAGVSDTIRRE